VPRDVSGTVTDAVEALPPALVPAFGTTADGRTAAAFADPVDLAALSPAEAVGFVRFMRDAAARNMPVRWRGRCEHPELRRALSHTAPPESPLSADGHAEWSRWRATHRLGVLYRRRGPGFAIVHDRRAHHAKPVRAVVGDDRLLAALEVADVPVDVRGSARARELDRLAAAGFVLRYGDLALTLPYRLPAWPVPAYSV
jgi:uncharacterized protein DUF5825